MRTSSGAKVNYTIGNGTEAEEAAKLNTVLAQSSLGLTASYDATNGITVTAINPGSASAFTATLSAGTAPVRKVTGTDIAGTIDGVEATGKGNVLTLAVDAESDAKGLSVAVNASAPGAIGSLEYKPGLAQSLQQLLSQVSDSESGAWCRPSPRPRTRPATCRPRSTPGPTGWRPTGPPSPRSSRPWRPRCRA